MAIRPIGRVDTEKLWVTINEAVVEGAGYVVTNGKATLVATTAAPSHIALHSLAASTGEQQAEFDRVYPGKRYSIDFTDVNGNCIYRASDTIGAANGATLVDTARDEADNTWQYMELCLHNFLNGSDITRIVSASDQSDTNITFTPVTDANGTALRVPLGVRYTITNIPIGTATVRLYTGCATLACESTVSGGKVIVEAFDYSNCSKGVLKALCRFDIT